MTETTDADLVARALSGEEAAYAALVDRHQARLMRYATRMLGNKQEAEEAVQDAFVRAYRSLARCSDPDRFGAWLFQILLNRCRTRAVAVDRRSARFVPEEAGFDSGTPHPEDRTAWREEIHRALGALPADHREAFLLKHVEDLSYEEMATTTGASIPALKMRVKRSCDRLRELLRDAHATR